ncbi:hypothetical protein FQR65_LT03056 [Abscondita terminalis]|nr:hypothetical protein FQR65_LT03056 [Abscondita terminalis]
MNTSLYGISRILLPNLLRINLSQKHFKCKLYYTQYSDRITYYQFGLPQREKHIFRRTGSMFNMMQYISTSSFSLSSVTIKAPVFPDSVSDGDLRWKKKVGDTVNMDEIIAEIETDKVALPVSAPSAGTIKELIAQEGAVIKSEAPLCTIEAK